MMIKDVEHLSASGPFQFSLLRILCLGLYLIFKIGLFGLLESNFLSSLYILESPLSDIGLVKIFPHSVHCCFVLLMVGFALQKLFSFMRSHLSIVNLRA